jgi:hypothetical protein
MAILLVQAIVKNSKCLCFMFQAHGKKLVLSNWKCDRLFAHVLQVCCIGLLTHAEIHKKESTWDIMSLHTIHMPCVRLFLLSCYHIYSKSLLWYSSNPNHGLLIRCWVDNCVEPQWPTCGFESYRHVVSSPLWSKSCFGKHCLCHFLWRNSLRRILLISFGSEIWANKFNYGDHNS